MAGLKQEQEEYINCCNEVCQGYWRTLKVDFEDKIYYVRIDNDDFNNLEIKVFNEDNEEIMEDNEEWDKVISYLESEKEI